jgi:hypothetical protein
MEVYQMNNLIKVGIPILAVMSLFIGLFGASVPVSADGTSPQLTNTCPYFDNNGYYGNAPWPGAGMMGIGYGTYHRTAMMGSGYGAYQGRNMMGGVTGR